MSSHDQSNNCLNNNQTPNISMEFKPNSLLISNNSRIVCLDLLRIVACSFVILLHVSAPFVSQMEKYPLMFTMNSWSWGNLIDSMTRSAVPLFIMLSGSFMLDSHREVDGHLVLKKIGRLIVVFLFWSLLYFFVNTLGRIIIKGKFPTYSIKTIFYSIASGSYHMWFFYLIISLYVLTPLLRLITKDESCSWYFLALSLVVTFIIPLLKSGAINELWNRSDFSFVKGYTFYYVIGIQLRRLFSKYKINNLLLSMAILIYLSSWLICFFVTWKINLGCSVLDQRLYANNSIITMLEAISLYTITCYIGQRSILPNIVSFIAKHCMGIYLAHVLGIEIIIVLFEKTGIIIYTPIYILLISVMVFVGCLFVTLIMAKLPVFKKMIYM